MRALERIEECRKPDRFIFWLLQIVRNHAHNARDYRKVRAAQSLDDQVIRAPDDAAARTRAGELSVLLEAALAALTPEQRQVILLKDLEGWDHRSIAASLGISEGMSRQHVFAARHKLKEALGSLSPEEYLHE